MLDRMKRAVGRSALKVVRSCAGNSLERIEREWAIVFPDADDEIQGWVKESVLDVVAAFSLAGHSGFSAGYTINLIEKALRQKPLGPLTGADDEWNDVGHYSGSTMYQNKRCSHVFKDSADGPAYDIEAFYYRDPDGCTYTRGGQRKFIEFPYYPGDSKEILVDHDGNELLPENIEIPRKFIRTLSTVIGEIAEFLDPSPPVTEENDLDGRDIIEPWVTEEGDREIDAALKDAGCVRVMPHEKIAPVVDFDPFSEISDEIKFDDYVRVPRGLLAAASYIIGKTSHAGGNVANKIRALSLQKREIERAPESYVPPKKFWGL